MTAIETLAMLIVGLSIVKLLFIFWKPAKWMTFTKKIYQHVLLTQIIFILLGGYVLWLLISNGITIIQIFAVMAFLALLFGAGLAPYVSKIVPLFKINKIIPKNLLFILIWILLLLWVFITLIG